MACEKGSYGPEAVFIGTRLKVNSLILLAKKNSEIRDALKALMDNPALSISENWWERELGGQLLAPTQTFCQANVGKLVQRGFLGDKVNLIFIQASGGLATFVMVKAVSRTQSRW